MSRVMDSVEKNTPDVLWGRDQSSMCDNGNC